MFIKFDMDVSSRYLHQTMIVLGFYFNRTDVGSVERVRIQTNTYTNRHTFLVNNHFLAQRYSYKKPQNVYFFRPQYFVYHYTVHIAYVRR